MAVASQKLNIPKSIMRKHKSVGADGFIYGRVYVEPYLAWLAKNNFEMPLPISKKQDEPLTTATPQPAEPVGTPGAAPALARLENEEADLHAAMRKAILAGEFAKADIFRASWLEVSAELRKYDNQVADSRRISGDSVQKHDVERWLHFLGVHVQKACYIVAVSIAGRLQIMAENPAKALSEIQTGLSNSFLTSLASLAALPCPARVPDWVVKAMAREGSEDALAARTKYFEEAIKKGLQ